MEEPRVIGGPLPRPATTLIVPPAESEREEDYTPMLFDYRSIRVHW